MKTVLVAIDLTPESDLVLARATELAKTKGADLVLLHVVSPQVPLAPAPAMMPVTSLDLVPERVKVAESRLASLCLELPGEVRATSRVEIGAPAETLLEAAEDPAVELLVIGAHAHGRLAQVLGTTAARIVNRSPVSTFVVRPPAPRSSV